MRGEDLGLDSVMDLIEKYGVDTPQHIKKLGAIKATLHPREPLMILCYTKEAAWLKNWTPAERVCRGLIVNYLNLEVVARPFEKFFNVGEMPDEDIDKYMGYSYNITEKLDGSLGIIYKLPLSGKYAVATKGSFTSEQAMWATDWLNTLPKVTHALDNYQASNIPITLMVEIIYPENSRDLVIKYGEDREGLTLLAGRFIKTGDELWRSNLENFGRATGLPCVGEVKATPSNLKELAKTETGIEGWVIAFSDVGTQNYTKRFKIKTEDYLRLHKLISNCTPKVIRDTMLMGEDKFTEYMMQLPEEFRAEAIQTADGFNAVAGRLTHDILVMWDRVSHLSQISRKDFAIEVNTNYQQYAKYLFALLDGKVDSDNLYYKVLADINITEQAL